MNGVLIGLLISFGIAFAHRWVIHDRLWDERHRGGGS